MTVQDRTGAFADRICVVTGGTQGVGEATALLMAQRGAAGVVICGRQRDAGQTVANEVEAVGSPCAYVPADLGRVDDAFAVVDGAVVRFGRIDVLVNAAGLTDRGTIEDTSVELFDRMIAVNTRAPFFLIQRAVPHLRRAGGGSIVNVISIAALGGAPFLAAYVASKAAMIGLTRNQAHALRHDRIRVNAVNMGWTSTPGEERIQRTAHGRGDDWLEEISQQRPFGRLLTPKEVAQAVCFLASEESGIATGTVMDFEQTVAGATD